MSNNQEVAKRQKDITETVLLKIEAFEKAGQIHLPPNYSAANALKSAFLVLKETKDIGKASSESIANALLKMVTWGLSPLKKQCAFIMYGSKLECSIEYSGNIALAKRYAGIKSIRGHAVCKGEKFSYEVTPDGRNKLIKHDRSMSSQGGEVIGAYAVIEESDGKFDMEVMMIDQIKKAWEQGAMKGNSTAHKNFPDQMAIKTVINRACKWYIRSSNDAVLFYDSAKHTETSDQAKESVQETIREEANREPIDFEDAEITTEDAEITTEEARKQPVLDF